MQIFLQIVQEAIFKCYRIPNSQLLLWMPRKTNWTNNISFNRSAILEDVAWLKDIKIKFVRNNCDSISRLGISLVNWTVLNPLLISISSASGQMKIKIPYLKRSFQWTFRLLMSLIHYWAIIWGNNSDFTKDCKNGIQTILLYIYSYFFNGIYI